MIRMICEDCRTVYYSAAGRIMVEQGERCQKCGGRLVLDEDGPGTGSRGPRVPVNAESGDDAPGGGKG
jgi:DNA-directed RNA polymerase subunit RPC12/RpoP